MVKLIIVRHGYSIYNRDALFAGQIDIPLDDRGIEQAQETCKYILDTYKIDRIYSSDLVRAYNTIKPLADALNLTIETDKGLREVDVGAWGGKPYTQIQKEFPTSAALYKQNVGLVRFDGGENYTDMINRSIPVFEKIVKENEGKTVAIATHGGLIRALCCVWLGLPVEEVYKVERVPNSSITVVNYQDGKFTIESLGKNEHLSCEITEVPLVK